MQNNERSAEAAAPGGPRQVLTFSLGRETYGVDILRVKEIRGWSPVTRLPRSPAAVLGVLNLRGAIVPIIDLRVRLELGAADFTPLTVIIVLSLPATDGHRECAIVVDSVKDVVDISSRDVHLAPLMNAGESSRFIEGITTCDATLLILLDAEKLATFDPAPANATSAAA
jgi:purine-binding chemotaxis protein CheW